MVAVRYVYRIRRGDLEFVSDLFHRQDEPIEQVDGKHGHAESQNPNPPHDHGQNPRLDEDTIDEAGKKQYDDESNDPRRDLELSFNGTHAISLNEGPEKPDVGSNGDLIYIFVHSRVGTYLVFPLADEGEVDVSTFGSRYPLVSLIAGFYQAEQAECLRAWPRGGSRRIRVWEKDKPPSRGPSLSAGPISRTQVVPLSRE